MAPLRAIANVKCGDTGSAWLPLSLGWLRRQHHGGWLRLWLWLLVANGSVVVLNEFWNFVLSIDVIFVELHDQLSALHFLYFFFAQRVLGDTPCRLLLRRGDSLLLPIFVKEPSEKTHPRLMDILNSFLISNIRNDIASHPAPIWFRLLLLRSKLLLIPPLSRLPPHTEDRLDITRGICLHVRMYSVLGLDGSSKVVFSHWFLTFW